MRWGSRTVLAGVAGVALAGAGALTAAYAATGPAPATTPSVSSDDSQVAALSREAHDLREQVTSLEAAVARVPLASEAPTPTEPAETPSASPAATFETPGGPATAAPSASTEPEHESGGHDDGGHDDGGFDD